MKFMLVWAVFLVSNIKAMSHNFCNYVEQNIQMSTFIYFDMHFVRYGSASVSTQVTVPMPSAVFWCSSVMYKLTGPAVVRKLWTQSSCMCCVPPSRVSSLWLQPWELVGNSHLELIFRLYLYRILQFSSIRKQNWPSVQGMCWPSAYTQSTRLSTTNISRYNSITEATNWDFEYFY